MTKILYIMLSGSKNQIEENEKKIREHRSTFKINI